MNSEVIVLARPFIGIRPVAGRADEIAAPPYDVVNTEEARAAAESVVKLTAHGAISDDTAIPLGLVDVRGPVAFCAKNTAAYAAERLCADGLGPVSIEKIDFLFRAETEALQQLLKKI